VDLNQDEQNALKCHDGPLAQFAMELVGQAGQIWGAERLIDVSFAHLDACHYYGRAHLDFVRMLTDQRARFAVPTWGNTLSVSLLENHSRTAADPSFVAEAREVARLYADLGCQPVWTCAPYLLPNGPQFGDQIIGSESNAVAYYNAVIGARTQKYGDFLDVACALLGKAPLAGLHTDAGRAASLVLDFSSVTRWGEEATYALIGAVMGQAAGRDVPVLTGIPMGVSDDALKNLAATGGATGGVAHFHVLGRTPEAPTLEIATQGRSVETQTFNDADLEAARGRLSSVRPGTKLSMVALGTPHFSVSEFAALAVALDGLQLHPDVTCYVSTSRFVADIAREEGSLEVLERAGVQVLVDTCTYFSPAVKAAKGPVMTNSGKWAYYAPGMLPVEVALGSIAECAQSAVCGEVVRHG